MEPRDAQRALHVALELGIDFVDTALVYGAERGVSERLVGESVRDLRARDRVVVATKIPPADNRWPADGTRPLHAAFPAAHVQACVEDSLRNLRLEVIPLQQLHVWHDAWLEASAWPELRGTMERMVREGKVLHWGISVNDAGARSGDALEILDQPIIETVQVIYNLFDRSAETALLARAAKHDVGVIARCPLDEGGLGGELGAGSQFPPGDWRHNYFGGTRLDELALRLARLSAFVGDVPAGARTTDASRAALAATVRTDRDVRDRKAELEADNLAELALRFVLSRDEIAVTIPGMRTAEHVRANLAAGDDRRLSPALLARLVEHAWDRNWYTW
jgi:aryl-alcohol dehydrogenase-like predicted oxidoreductase